MNPRPAKPSDGVCWITGGSSGIGAALALEMAARGWTVAITARDRDKLEDVAAQAQGEGQGRIHVFPSDITGAYETELAVQGIEDRLGPIALAVLNAGVYIPVHAENPEFEDYEKTFAVNLNGTAACLCALTPRMTKRGKGQIAIVSSATAFGGMPTASAYGASKAALVNMAECHRIELHRFGVLVQAVTPGFVETPAQDGNEFPKPFMIQPEEAAKRIAQGLDSSRFEITFPRRFTWALKAIYGLPFHLALPLVRRQTGWNKSPESDGGA